MAEDFVEQYDDLQSVCDFPEHIAPLPRDTTPVALGTTPEYFNFWQGKPLKYRDWTIPQYGRKSRPRPKSDYGSRFYSRRKSDKSSQDGDDASSKGDGTEGLNLDDLMGLGGKAGGRDGKDVSLAVLITLEFLCFSTKKVMVAGDVPGQIHVTDMHSSVQCALLCDIPTRSE